MRCSVALIAALAAMGAVGCARTPAFPARGTAGHDFIATTVDSRLAQYYLEHYLSGTRDQPDLDQRIAAVVEAYDRQPLNTEALVRLARETSNDFAALYFAERQTKAHPDLKDRFVAYTARPGRAKAVLTTQAEGYVVVFVPGLFHKSNPANRAAMLEAEHILQALGVATDRIDTTDAGSVEENAGLIADFIAGDPHPDRAMILVSASKGGPEVLYALGVLLPEVYKQRVRAWVSIGGVLRGSQIADEYMEPPDSWLVAMACRWSAVSCDLVGSMSTGRSRDRLRQASLPEALFVLHYVGVPLSGTVTGTVKGAYRRMSAYGPSDGLTLLTDQLLPAGQVVTDLGLDHLFQHPRIERKVVALTRTLFDLLARTTESGLNRD